MSNFSTTQTIAKTVIETEHGIVAAQHSLAARAGAEVLATGGDAVDAAVATSFAIGVLEPWMSGPAGGGVMMLWRADEGRAHVINYGMRSPAALDPANYPLAGTGRAAADLFPWEAVVDDRNVQGATSIAVPGVVDGLGQAHERFGRMPWAELLSPAIRHAREGLHVDWYAALIIASATRALATDPDAAALYLEDGRWPTIASWTSLSDKRIDMSRMGLTLEEIARNGAREMYDGDVGAAIAADVKAKGGSLSAEDLRAYRATFEAPITFAHGRARFHVASGLTAGPTFRDAFAALNGLVATGDDRPGPDAFAAYASALRSAYATRLSGMGHGNESPQAPSSTTHFSVVDRHGNMVAQTQTLLSIFGSKVVSPQTGLLMNNGIMWFDPEQGRPNSLAGGKRCLMNVCPVIGETGDTRFAIGASGGRKIVSAMVQMASFMTDFDMEIGAAFHHPRMDVSGGDVVIADEAMAPEILSRLRAGGEVVTTPRTVFPYAFACPAGVMRRGDRNSGCTEIMSPWGDAVEGRAHRDRLESDRRSSPPCRSPAN